MSEIERFLGAHPPFDGLAVEDLATVARSVQVEYFPAGELVLQQEGIPAGFLYVVRTGSVEFLADEEVVDVLEEGEVFGHPSLLSGAGPNVTVRAAEDTLCYLIPRDVAEKVLGTPSGLSFLAMSLHRRLERSARTRDAALADPRLGRVDSLLRGPLIDCDADQSVRSAADLMARERRSALLVRADGGVGIVTDADLRTKVVAQGLSSSRPVRDVMTFPAPAVSGDRLVHEALLEMLAEGIDHLVVTDGAGRPVGVLSDTDVLGLERRRPFVLRAQIERAHDVEKVAALGRELPEAMVTLVHSGLEAVDIGHIVALIVDALTRRLIHLAIEDLGHPPAPWAWIALGSEARREQALATDQDHALAYADGAEDAEPFFAGIGARIVEGLERCGIPRCRAGVIASEPEWRRSVSGWKATFDGWMRARAPEPVALTTIGFDYRAISGPLVVEPELDRTVRTAWDRPAFLRRLAMAALDFEPPVALRGRPVAGGRRVLDLKRGGLLPVIDLARLFGLEAGSSAKGTLERLRVAEGGGVIDGEARSVLEEAFRVVLDARLVHQAEQVEAAERPDNLVDPSSLGRLARTRLKEAFRAIAEVQRAVRRRFHVPRIG
ncbi:MAG: DUF294 nucleotidyltransferase-like domain-containing protein [Actinomycetota bacterium]